MVQLCDRKNNFELTKEKIKTYVKLPRSNLVIVGQSEKVKQTAQ